MNGFNPINVNHTKENKVVQIATHYKEKFNNGIDLGEIEFQIRNSNLDVDVKFANGYKMTILDNQINDFASGHINLNKALSGCTFVRL